MVTYYYYFIFIRLYIYIIIIIIIITGISINYNSNITTTIIPIYAGCIALAFILTAHLIQGRVAVLVLMGALLSAQALLPSPFCAGVVH